MKNVLRQAFVMQVHPGNHDEYIRRHNPIWPDLESVLKSHGVRTYSIFLDTERHLLFAYVEFRNQEEWNRIAQTEVCQRWWRHMSEIMPSNPDFSPQAKPLPEVFHLMGEDGQTS